MESNNLVSKRTGNAFSTSSKILENELLSIGRAVPQAIPFEEAVLGAMMLEVDAVNSVIDILKEEVFYKEVHQKIYAAIKQLFLQNEPVDILSVSHYLRKMGALESVGGSAYLSNLTQKVVSSANIEFHARILMEKYILRELILNCNTIIKEAYDTGTDVLKLLDESETRLFSIVEDNFKKDSQELDVLVKQAIEDLQKIQKEEDTFRGVHSGLKSLDTIIGGWQNSSLIILAARPGMGKTSMVLSVARNAVIDFNKTVVLFSLEMSSIQLVHRLFSIETGIDSNKISKGQISEPEWDILMQRAGSLMNANLIIDDTPSLSVFELRAKCRRLKQKHDIQLIIIDYLQLMQGTSDVKDKYKAGNREQEISQISRSLKALARELDIPVIALSQLNRSVETRGGSKRPLLSDLRESGSIEQDADMVLFIYRPEYYGIENMEDSENTSSKGVAEIIVAKNRHGSLDTAKVKFIAQYTKFTDCDDNMKLSNAKSEATVIQPDGEFETGTILQSKMNDNDIQPTNLNHDDDVPF